MPSYPCGHPTCTNYVTQRGDYCEEHAGQRVNRDQFYDQHYRNKEAKQFYNSAAWLRARGIKLTNDPVCERCQRVFAEHVHHRIPLSRCTIKQRLDQENLKSLCTPCHNIEEAELRKLECNSN